MDEKMLELIENGKIDEFMKALEIENIISKSKPVNRGLKHKNFENIVFEIYYFKKDQKTIDQKQCFNSVSEIINNLSIILGMQIDSDSVIKYNVDGLIEVYSTDLIKSHKELLVIQDLMKTMDDKSESLTKEETQKLVNDINLQFNYLSDIIYKFLRQIQYGLKFAIFHAKKNLEQTEAQKS